MQRSLMVNGVLVALALVTLGVVWATRDAPTTSELAARRNKLLTSYDEQAVTRVRLRRGGDSLELARDARGGDFRLVHPWAERADVASVSSLLKSLDLAAALRPADGVAREVAGLTQPALEIQLEMSGKTATLRLGGPAPAPPGARYAEVEAGGGEARLFVVSQGMVDELDLSWDRFREPRLVEQGKSDFAKLHVEGASGRVVLEQREHDTFFVLSGAAAELANRDAVDRILVALSRMTTERFVEPEQARAALGAQPVRARLELKAAGEPPVLLTLGGACPAQAERIVALRERAGHPDKAGCVAPELRDALDQGPAALALDRPFSVRPDEVEELVITQGDRKLELARKGSGFLLRAPSSGNVALSAGNLRISELVQARGRRSEEPPAALGLEPAAGRITIRTTAGDRATGRSELVSIGRPRADGSLCVRRELDAVVLCLEVAAAQAFQPDATTLKDLELTHFAASDLAAFSVETGGARQRVRRSDDGSFVLEEPPGLRHDGGLVSDVVQLLGSLRAERWLADEADARHGLAAPRLRVSIEPAQGGSFQRRELVVGAETSGGYFATLSPDPGVFVLPRSSVRALEAPLIDRALCPLTQSELEGVELRAGARRLSIARRGGGYEAPGLSGARAAALIDTLLALRADFTVRLGPARAAEGMTRPSLSVTFLDAKGGRRLLLVGARETLDGAAIAYARLDSVDATFALAASTLAALQDF